ncbi:MAG: type III-A CRISPR-associated RAMP protein Csm3 [Saprospiraceae bacterium]|nr:type III-A CRISPR-associated RAMP protein Csm3 [Saprospiraceae bacterium]MDW8483097.1 type III-A CRISPR-associated RAMP protein Csm3 [Saprospiraceae bacterium]
MELKAKIFITGKIRTLTGLHIGGAKSALDIGGIDLNVIKKPDGTPYIPGSSLKGKLRSLLARVAGTVAITAREAKGEKCDVKDAPYICEIFGLPGDDSIEDRDNSASTRYVTRLIVRDADLDTNSEVFENELELQYSEVKWENSINRKTGTAQNPRQLERVPAGAVFHFEMVYDDYEDGKTQDHLERIRLAMMLLESDYLGGHGSRGYGKIAFEDVRFTRKTISDFEQNKEAREMDFKYKL